MVMVEFYATWCPHCQRMMPIVEQIRELMEGEVKIYQLDIDKNQEVADEGVESTPTFMLYRDNELVWKQAGEVEGGSAAWQDPGGAEVELGAKSLEA